MSKVWLVTGSSRGLGRAIAQAVLEGGDKLIATARQVDGLQDLNELSEIVSRQSDLT